MKYLKFLLPLLLSGGGLLIWVVWGIPAVDEELTRAIAVGGVSFIALSEILAFVVLSAGCLFAAFWWVRPWREVTAERARDGS